jgi:hypothetical protein
MLNKCKKNVSWFVVFCMILTIVLFGAVPGVVSAAPPTSSSVVITSPLAGANLSSGIVRITGTFSKVYQVVISINAEEIYDCVMDVPLGDDTGTWYYDLDTSKYDGSVEIFARGFDTTTRYFTWASTVTVNVNNSAANIPAVTINNPVDASSVSGTVPVSVAVAAKNSINSVQVRINGGSWSTAAPSGGNYIYNWVTTGIGSKTCSIEAKAVDSLGNTGFSMTTYAKVGTGTNETVVMQPQDRAMWIWEPASYNLLQNAGSRTVLDAFCKDTTLAPNPVKTLYLYADRYNGSFLLKDNPAAYREFISWAHSNGYKVYALLASSMYLAPAWSYTRYQSKATKLMENIINYNISSASSEKFDGVNSDIEPHGLPDWLDKPVVQLQFLNMLNNMVQRRNVAGVNLTFGPAVPRWLDENSECSSISWNGKSQYLGYHIQDMCDYISVMDYRDEAGGPSGIIAHGQQEINYANSIGKPDSVVIGVETDDVAMTGDPEKISFHEEGRTYMEGQLSLVYSAFNSALSFGGVGIHHYDSYRELPTVWGTNGTVWSSPSDTTAPSAISGTVTANTFDFQRIDLKFGSATDNTEIAKYNVYRSTTSGFTPGASNLAGGARLNFFKDGGLLPNTTYYYKVCAIDVKGNIGPATVQVSATTANTTLKPMTISQFSTAWSGSLGSVSLTVVDKTSGAIIASAAIHGHFTYSAGKYVDTNTNSSGIMSSSTESLSDTHGCVSFVPDRIMKSGCYWAYAYDVNRSTSTSW